MSVVPGIRKCPNKGRAIIQLQQASIEVFSDDISEADRLNGIEWKGSMELNYAAARYHVLERLAQLDTGTLSSPTWRYKPPVPPDKKWSDWKGAGTAVRMALKRVKGSWEIDACGRFDPPPEPPHPISEVDIGFVSAAKGSDNIFEEVSDIPK